jgi:Family of unknown function (DUF5691)
VSLWSDLISAALVGTDRRPVPAPPAGSPFDLPFTTDGPDRLLDLAATLTLARRAGVRPQAGVVLPAKAPPESIVPVSPVAAGHLTSLLHGQPRGQQAIQQRAELLTEWLSLAERHRRRVPPALLPRLLDEAGAREEWRPVVEAVGGARAAWLAAHNPRWAWLLDQSPVDDASLWHEGTAAQRLSYVTGLRRRDPDRARGLLGEALPGEPPANRAALLSTLEVGLSAADEALLEPALDDRRMQVRLVAASLLGTLPGSAYQRRMTARSLACLVRGDTGELVVTPPAECDRAMRRDGIEPKPPQGTGERAWWFQQLLARTPLSAWQRLEPEPAVLLRRAVADDWQPVVHRGWAEATVDQHDTAWAAAFVRGDSPAMSRANSAAIGLVQSLYQQLAPADAVEVAIAMLDADDTYAEYVLPTCPRPWPAGLIAAAMARLRRFTQRPGYMLSTLITQAAAGFPPDQALAVRELVESNRAEHGDDPHTPFFDRLAETLTFRHQMHQEFP